MITGGLCGAPASPGATGTPRSWLGKRARLLVPFMLVVGLLSCGTGAAGPGSAAIRCPAPAPATGPDQAGGPASGGGLLFSPSTPRHDRGPRTPDLVGLPAAAAAAVSAKRHFSLYVTGARADARARFDYVIFQSLPPGAINAGPGNQVSVIVAVRAAPACLRSQLTLTYRGGGFGAGNDFGGIIIRDTSPQPCRLTGRARGTGLGAH